MPLSVDSLNADLNALFCDMPQSVTLRRVGKQTFTAPAAISDAGASSAAIRTGATGIDVVDSVSVTVALSDCLWRPMIGDILVIAGDNQVYRISSARAVPGDVALDLIAEVM